MGKGWDGQTEGPSLPKRSSTSSHSRLPLGFVNMLSGKCIISHLDLDTPRMNEQPDFIQVPWWSYVLFYICMKLSNCYSLSHQELHRDSFFSGHLSWHNVHPSSLKWRCKMHGEFSFSRLTYVTAAHCIVHDMTRQKCIPPLPMVFLRLPLALNKGLRPDQTRPDQFGTKSIWHWVST